MIKFVETTHKIVENIVQNVQNRFIGLKESYKNKKTREEIAELSHLTIKSKGET